MLNLYNAVIETICLHKVGNKSRNEKAIVSNSPLKIDEEFHAILKEFFLKPFREKTIPFMHFAHDVDIEFNEIYNQASQIFNTTDSDLINEFSKFIVAHLWEQSNHPHIKSGEVYVVKFSNLGINDEYVDAIGIFKSEIKSDFIQVEDEGKSSLEMKLLQGISLDKLDKGCIIFNTEKENGFKILTVDANKYDSRYWLEHFLNVDVDHDDAFVTKKYLKMVKDFGKNVVEPAEDKKEALMFQNKALNYMASNDEFEEEQFITDMFDSDSLAVEFRNFRIQNEEKYDLDEFEGDVSFKINNEAVNDMRKEFKSKIKLDTNIEIKMDFVNPDSMEQFVEKGWDEEKQMYYYLVYFNKEVK